MPDPIIVGGSGNTHAQSRARKVSRSDVVRERLEQRGASSARTRVTTRDLIRDLIGSVDGLPPDLSQRTDDALKATGYGRQVVRCLMP